MRKKVITTVVTFSTTTAAMKMEKTAKEAEFPGRLIPIPSEISAQCGLAWRCVEQSEEEAEVFLKKKRIDLGWHLSCFSIKWILFVVYNKTEISGNFRIFIVK